MRDPSEMGIKAWAREYEEAPFFFEQSSEYGRRLVAWTEEPEQMRKAFYGVVGHLSENVSVLLKISVGKAEDGKPLWSRYHGIIDRDHLLKVIKDNDAYVFSDGMHQLCVKDEDGHHYLAFDDHGIFFIYSPTKNDTKLFSSLGFESRHADPIYTMPHFQSTPPESEKLEAKFVADLGLEKVKSDVD